MADKPQKVSVSTSRIDSSIIPDSFSTAYRLIVLSQASDLEKLAGGANVAGEMAYQATVKNEEQDVELTEQDQRITTAEGKIANHEFRITTSENKIAAIEGRLDTAESDIDYLIDEVAAIQGDYVSKSSASNQGIQAAGGSLLVGNVTTPTGDKLQVAGSANASVSYKVGGTKVLGPRVTGFVAIAGTPNLNTFNADYTETPTTTYNPDQQKTIFNLIREVRQKVKAHDDAIRTHGLIS